MSHNKVGDALADQGSLDEALASYGASLAIFERLAADRSHAGWQSDLSVAYERISTVLRSKSYIDEALARYRKSLAIRARLATEDSQAMSDMAEPAEALAEFRNGRQIVAARVDRRPDSAEWNKELGVV